MSNKRFEGNCRVLVEALSGVCTEETVKNLARISDEPDEIRTEHLRDTNLSVIVIPIYGFLPDFSTSHL
jgi:hypothetical protein